MRYMTDPNKKAVLKQGERLFSRIVGRLNEAYPERTQETWEQICYALALAENETIKMIVEEWEQRKAEGRGIFGRRRYDPRDLMPIEPLPEPAQVLYYLEEPTQISDHLKDKDPEDKD